MHVFSCGGTSITIQIHQSPFNARAPLFHLRGEGTTYTVLQVDERGRGGTIIICQAKVVPQPEGGDRPLFKVGEGEEVGIFVRQKWSPQQVQR